MDKILDASNVRHGSGDGWNPVGKEGELFPPLRNGDISIDRIFIVDDIEIWPL